MDAILVFARMDSARLPGKVLADLGGRPLLGRVLDRVRRAVKCRRVVVATSDRPIDDTIADFSRSEGADVFRGDHMDVARRALDCCDALGLGAFVRISGDSPFMPPELIDRGLELAREAGADLVTNVFPRSFPPGASVEVIQIDALRRAYGRMNQDEREHVSTYFYAAAKEWKIVNFRAAVPAHSDIRLTVDTVEELENARRLIGLLMPEPEAAPLEDVVAMRRSLEVTT